MKIKVLAKLPDMIYGYTHECDGFRTDTDNNLIIYDEDEKNIYIKIIYASGFWLRLDVENE